MNTALRRVGWEVRRVADWPSLLSHLRPATVIDVGAADGTPQLYASFPAAYHVLIDPLEEYRQELDQGVLSEYHGEFVNMAVGSSEATLEMNVDPGMPTRSSFQERTSLTARGILTEARDVPVTTLDRLWLGRGWKPPFFIKIDSEGHELEVLRGAATLLPETVGVLAETSVIPRFRGGYTLDQLVGAMAQHGFVATNVLEMPVDRAGRVPFLNLLFER